MLLQSIKKTQDILLQLLRKSALIWYNTKFSAIKKGIPRIILLDYLYSRLITQFKHSQPTAKNKRTLNQFLKITSSALSQTQCFKRQYPIRLPDHPIAYKLRELLAKNIFNQPTIRLELDNDKLDSSIQPANPQKVFYVRDQLISSATNKQDCETFAIDDSANSANVFKEIGEKVSESITLPEISAVNLSVDLPEDIQTSYSLACLGRQYYCKENKAQHFKGQKNGVYKRTTIDRQYLELNITNPLHEKVTKEPARKGVKPLAIFHKKRLKTLPYSWAAIQQAIINTFFSTLTTPVQT